MSSIWFHKYYFLFGFLFLVFLILIITCAEISIVMCYFQLCSLVSYFLRSSIDLASSAFPLFFFSVLPPAYFLPSCFTWLTPLQRTGNGGGDPSSLAELPPSTCFCTRSIIMPDWTSKVLLLPSYISGIPWFSVWVFLFSREPSALPLLFTLWKRFTERFIKTRLYKMAWGFSFPPERENEYSRMSAFFDRVILFSVTTSDNLAEALERKRKTFVEILRVKMDPFKGMTVEDFRRLEEEERKREETVWTSFRAFNTTQGERPINSDGSVIKQILRPGTGRERPRVGSVVKGEEIKGVHLD